MNTFEVLIIITILIYIYITITHLTIHGRKIHYILFIPFILYITSVIYFFIYISSIDLFISIIELISISIISFVFFAPYLKYILKKIGFKNFTGSVLPLEEVVRDEVIEAVKTLSENNIGALITFQQEMNLETSIKKSVLINAKLSYELLLTIFNPHSALHDGGVIIVNDIIKYCGAIYSVSSRKDIPNNVGTRHRAGLALAEDSDSLTIIISEESSSISVAINGTLDYDMSIESLALYLDTYLIKKNK